MTHTHIFPKYFLPVLILSGQALFLSAQSFPGDTCSLNDICETAIPFPLIFADQPYNCMNGCNLNAAPDPVVNQCQMGDFPTVWYEVGFDTIVQVMNIDIRSDDFESPVISLFKSKTGCGSLETAFLTNSNLSCVIGAQGIAKAIGTAIDTGYTYYIAVSSLNSIGGNFTICVSAIAKGSYCVLDREIVVTARSNGGPLEGPFEPGEKISVCMNVNQYTPVGNGCQWFQGIIPMFGNGWDPTSFDADDQPLNATINGLPIGTNGNGIYGTTIDWFTDVGYHHDNPRFKIGDFDGNGRLELCNGVYELNCTSTGINGGCCGPCWEDAGDILPPGWFAYGINGSCMAPGPPISVDWGDGNSCGSVMGPWSFCFDLVTRSVPDCMGDSTKKDLSLGFNTFADGETGAWTGGESVCSYDQPVKLTLKTQCGRVTRMPEEPLQDLCAGDVFKFTIEGQGITHWEWNLQPSWVAPVEVVRGPNGFTIETQVHNPYPEVQEVTGMFIGKTEGNEDIVIRKVKFNVNPCHTDIIPLLVDNDPDPVPEILIPGEGISGSIIHRRSAANEIMFSVYPVPSTDRIVVKWSVPMNNDAALTIYDLQGQLMKQSQMKSGVPLQKVVDISDLSPGVYFISLRSGEFRSVVKMIKI
jgi:hypothetical protein